MEHSGTYVLLEFEDEPPLALNSEFDRRTNADASAEPTRRPSILLVDDDTHMLEVQLRMLRSVGYPFNSVATSGQEALLQLEHDPRSADVIVCDLGMPGMDGIEFLQTLNASSFRGSVILHSCQSARVMHSVQRLLGGSQLTILGALTKPAGRDAFKALLECWQPRKETPAKTMPYTVSSADLRAATPRRQWVLHYQPQVSLRTGELTGMEALLRWNHPDYGLLYPDQFIAQAENCGAIDAITDWVVRDALKQWAHWRSEGLNVPLSINLSMENLCSPNFCRTISELARTTGIAPQSLTLEITETRIGSAPGIPLENLIRLRLERFNLSIDDFGTGHSSLAQLRDVPFNELKIDRGFVRGARDNQIIRPILEGSLGIAKRMGMTAVAEGVESKEDWQLLQELDCDFAQGYFIGRPMSVAQVLEWLYEWQVRVPFLLRP
jgi:EAL domain-containing protein (putative c-di-GMP-specific phosphodiesterase class I)/FixJ family two-component response regulator